ncbi:hypothetical protein ACFE04_015003 [Oxalis oulophora]
MLVFLTVPIFSSLPSEQQMKAFSPTPNGFCKVILATNIAETSVTIPRIKYVVDPGFVKARCYDPLKGMESLCYHLYPESEFSKLEDSTKPEIKRCNLSNVILQLKALGADDIVGFDFIEKPPRATIVKSLEQLFLLGALTDDVSSHLGLWSSDIVIIEILNFVDRSVFILSSYFDELNDRALASGEVVQIHPSSVLFRKKPECIIFNELVQTSNKFIRNVTRIDYLWLTELAPHYYTM